MSTFYGLIISRDLYNPESEAGKNRLRFLINALKPYRHLFGSKALDIGCGAGTSTFALEELGLSVVGIDRDKLFIEKARKIAEKRRSRAKFFVADARTMSVRDVFDSVFMLGDVIIHFSLTEFIRMIQNIRRATRRKFVLVLEYSDFVESLLRKEEPIPIPTELRGKVYYSYNADEGCLKVIVITREIGPDKYEAEEVKMYIWSPWVLEYILLTSGFTLISRERYRNGVFIDIHKEVSGEIG